MLLAFLPPQPIPGADAATTTGSAALPRTQRAALAWLKGAGVAVSPDAAAAAGFGAAVAKAEGWMAGRGALGGSQARCAWLRGLTAAFY